MVFTDWLFAPLLEQAKPDLEQDIKVVRMGDGALRERTDNWLLMKTRDTAAPARLFTQSGEDLRLLQYGNPAAADWFPRVLELWKGDQLLARGQLPPELSAPSAGHPLFDRAGAPVKLERRSRTVTLVLYQDGHDMLYNATLAWLNELKRGDVTRSEAPGPDRATRP